MAFQDISGSSGLCTGASHRVLAAESLMLALYSIISGVEIIGNSREERHRTHLSTQSYSYVRLLAEGIHSITV